MRSAIASFTEIAANPAARRFASVIFLVGFGVEISRAAQTTFFLQNVGADQLPAVFICFAMVMVAASSVYVKAAQKVRLEFLAKVVPVCKRTRSTPTSASTERGWRSLLLTSICVRLATANRSRRSIGSSRIV